MEFRKRLGKEILFFDGAMGSLLQKSGLPSGYIPEYWNIEKPEVIKEIHKSYLKAGANIIETNSFGANPAKMEDAKYDPADLMKAAVTLARESIEEIKNDSLNNEKPMYVAASLGTTGRLLEPLGDMTFDQAYEGYKKMWMAAEEAGADLVLIETMTDTYELKAGILAAKENTSLPIIASVMLNENGQLLTGANIEAVVTLLEGLRVDALGINCGFGPHQMAEFVKEMVKTTRLPMLVNPNAGLPKVVGGQTVYDLTIEEFVEETASFVEAGVCLIGGCCGTTPDHIKALVKACSNFELKKPQGERITRVSSYSHSVKIGQEYSPVVIGEKINPTGNKIFKEALKNDDIGTVLKIAKDQGSRDAHVLDINVGLPELDEVKTLLNIMKNVQSVMDLPLMIDTSNTKAMEIAVRYYNGKPFINSVNGKAESMEAVLPIAKKYGGVLIALTLDENGIPKTAEGRYQVAKKIVDKAAEYGIGPEDIVVDPLTLTVSADKNAAAVTLESIRFIKEKLGVKTSLGVSNVSFGLPSRENITATFYAMALQAGLDAAIMNPFSEKIMSEYYSFRALAGLDESCLDYIARFENTENTGATKLKEYTLMDSIVSGLKGDARAAAEVLAKDLEPLEIIDKHIIPALEIVGIGFEKGTTYLPQLLMSAEAAQEAFAVVKLAIAKTGQGGQTSKGKIILATVQGDIHDIGKNIVKVLLENYGYDIIDLGKNVAATDILAAAKKEKVRLVGLSALMTTTVPSMEETIKLLRAEGLDCKVVVGGAVLTDEYAKMIHADCYCKDAMATVRYAEQLYNR
ncbi:MAG: homocysteine S-methyltransferase family protein [Anaerovoracaceae bacterium]